ncbi:MAG: single-stranded DNA-binding protein [Armatimonadetes bacterium]|jgi:single-strand DNA-binding protein|nr:single-stranded DNA-binding protein [Armatimonadota bacterium]
MSLNKVILIGRLTRDPELRYTPSGVALCTFTLAVDRSFTSQGGERETDFIGIKVWREQGERVNQYMAKGRLVAVEGRLETRSWVGQDGQKRYGFDIVAENVQFLDRAPDGQQGRREAPEAGPDTERQDPQTAAPGYAPTAETTAEMPGGYDAPVDNSGIGDPFADE